MSKATIIALVLMAALVASASAERNLQRYLQQSFSCTNIGELEGKCQNLCCCVVKQDKSLEKYKSACAGLCNTCINDCKKSTDKKLSKTCNDALNIAPGTTGAISKCLDLYNSAKDKQKAIGEFASC